METRLDTYLWAIRMFKSRTLASEAIKAGKVKFNDAAVKPSRFVKMGESYSINRGGGHKKMIEVIEIINKRGEYELVKNCYVDHSPLIEKKLENIFLKTIVQQTKGSGRPTKKNRRDLGKQGGWF